MLARYYEAGLARFLSVDLSEAVTGSEAETPTQTTDAPQESKKTEPKKPDGK